MSFFKVVHIVKSLCRLSILWFCHVIDIHSDRCHFIFHRCREMLRSHGFFCCQGHIAAQQSGSTDRYQTICLILLIYLILDNKNREVNPLKSRAINLWHTTLDISGFLLLNLTIPSEVNLMLSADTLTRVFDAKCVSLNYM